MTHLKLQKSQKSDITQQHIDILGDVLVGNITFFVIFAVLDVSLDVNLCINCSFLHLYLLYNPPLLTGELKVNKRVVGVERTCSELKFQTLWAMMTSHTGRDQRNRRQVADV